VTRGRSRGQSARVAAERVGLALVEREAMLELRQFLYFCTSKASKLRTLRSGRRRRDRAAAQPLLTSLLSPSHPPQQLTALLSPKLALRYLYLFASKTSKLRTCRSSFPAPRRRNVSPVARISSLSVKLLQATAYGIIHY
jgi:hypothetical protein